jgi:hypothetical protein
MLASTDAFLFFWNWFAPRFAVADTLAARCPLLSDQITYHRCVLSALEARQEEGTNDSTKTRHSSSQRPAAQQARFMIKAGEATRCSFVVWVMGMFK